MEKAEGQDTVAFLEKWIPEALGVELQETLVIEQSHRIGKGNVGEGGKKGKETRPTPLGKCKCNIG